MNLLKGSGRHRGTSNEYMKKCIQASSKQKSANGKLHMDTLIVKNLDGEILDVLFSVPRINLRHQNTNYTETTSMKMIVSLHP